MKRLSEFDSVRGIAVVMVIGFHYELSGFQLGFLGVDIFFVLSGYLITSILVNEWKITEKINLPQFYLRRILRLYPALLFTLILVSPIEPFPDILGSLFYIANWGIALNFIPSLDKFNLCHIWSLSVEEQFYIIWPVLLILMLRSKLSRNLLAIVPLIIAIVSISERFILYTEGTWLTRIYRGTDTHADGLLIGATLALTLAFGIRYRKLFKYLGIIFLLLSLLYAAGLVSGFIDKNTIYQGGFTLLNLLFAYLIYRLITNPMTILNGILSFKPLVFIGKISYGIYLFHFPIMTILHGMFSIPSYITIPFTILFSMFSYRYIESPFLRLKDRLCRIDSGKISPDPVLKEYFRIDSGKIDSDNPV